MTPIFDKEAQLIAWINEDGYIFSKSIKWIAFVKNDNVFSKNCRWLGGLLKGTIIDKSGRPGVCGQTCVGNIRQSTLVKK